MAITYKDTKRSQSSRPGLGPLLVAIAAAVGLLWLSPQTAAKLQSAVASMIKLPIF